MNGVARVMLAAFAVLALGVVLWGVMERQSVAAQGNVCDPGKNDKVNWSSIRTTGPLVRWDEYPGGCEYRVILRSKDNARLDAQNVDSAEYTIPAELVTHDETYEIIIHLLKDGRPAGSPERSRFIYSGLPFCEDKPTGQSEGTPVPTPTPDFSPDAHRCLLKPPEKGASGTSDEYTGPPGPGSGISRHYSNSGASGTTRSSFNFSDSIHRMNCSATGNNCPSNPTGIDHIEGNVSARVPRLPEGKSWNDYHYFNRIHVVNEGERDVICPISSGINYTGPEHIAVGFAKGLFGTTIYHNELIVEKYYRDVTNYGKVKCEIVGTGRIHNDPSAIFYGIHRSGNVWQVTAWFGDWVDVATVHTTWRVAPSVVYGQEIWARNGDKHNVLAPLNFIHHVNIKGNNNVLGPWHDTYLQTPLKGRSESIPEAPFSVTDLARDDRTSISSCVPVNNLCE